MEPFPHLSFVQKITGRARLNGGGKANEISSENKRNRQVHTNNLIQQTNRIKSDWDVAFATREDEGLARLDSEVIPVFLQINPELLLIPEFDLSSLGVEIISEENDGFIVGASVDNLRSLEDKINEFAIAKHGSGKIADLWRIIDGNREEWKPQNILSKELLEKWDSIDDDEMYDIEVGIAFDRPLGPEPDESKKGGPRRLAAYRQNQLDRDSRLLERENNFEEFVSHYGELTSDIVELEDCFGCEIAITGKGLKDLVFNYPFVFEVNELDEVEGVSEGDSQVNHEDFEMLAPNDEAPIVGVIDSGVMENHRYLELAIDSANSKSYLTNDNSKVDQVQGGGHGTRVAGAILYPLGISNYPSPYQLPCFIRNLRVLDANKILPHNYPANLMKRVLEDNQDCSLYNMSINSVRTHRRKHMSTWAAILDKSIFDKNVLVVISAGNLYLPTVRAYLNQGLNYPEYLEEPYCSIANPAQSCFSITVGSVNHATFDDAYWQSLGNERCVSAFSRIGPGIWGTIKPDVVEYGGGVVVSKNGINSVRESPHTAPELLRSTLHGGSHNGCDVVGTSFAAPKVTHILSKLKSIYSDENVNLFRALIVHGARLPDGHFENPSQLSLRHFGYGIPSVERVIRNTEHRVTFYNTENIKAEEGHIYSLKIPEGLRGQGDEYDILIEVTLAYTAKIRRTRQKIKSYLGTWLDWDASKLEETFEQFQSFALRQIEGNETQYDREQRKELDSINWKIGNRVNSGDVQDFNRSNNTIQKDWAFIKSYHLPTEIGFVIRGHKGWDKKKESIPYAFTVSIEILGTNIPIYESIKVENEELET